MRKSLEHFVFSGVCMNKWTFYLIFYLSFQITSASASDIPTGLDDLLIKPWNPTVKMMPNGIFQIYLNENKITYPMYSAVAGAVCGSVYLELGNLEGVKQVHVLNKVGAQGFVFNGGKEACNEIGKLVGSEADERRGELTFVYGKHPRLEKDNTSQETSVKGNVVKESQPNVTANSDCPPPERAADYGTSGYIFALDEAGLVDFNAEELRLIRNEIYARHGYIFGDKKLKSYFSAKEWYSGENTNAMEVYCDFNDVTRESVDLLRRLEKKVKPNTKKGIKCQSFSFFGEPPSTDGMFHKFPVTHEDLKGLNAKELRLLRNEYFAKHGLIFKDKELREYFEQQTDYHPTISDSEKIYCEYFNQSERESVDLIRSFEKK